MADLHVELYGRLVGHLVGRDWRTFRFEADRSAFEKFQLGSTVLSEAVPLLAIPNRSHYEQHRNFFAELLPEGRILTALASRISVPEYDTISLLRQYGQDVAGALQIWDPDQPGEPKNPYKTPISDGEIEVLLYDTSAFPLGNKPFSGKTSLAGVQDKILLAHVDGQWNQVHDGYPSTHILKPLSRDYPTTIFDEEYGCRLARLLGLARHATRIVKFKSAKCLVIERYDRDASYPSGRLHQEDMNQALGAHANEKYQEFGGKVSLKRIAQVFSKRHDASSLERLLSLTTLSVAIGNLDMHAKNVSILHYLDESSAMAPAYDVVPMRHLPNDGRMALSVNAKYSHRDITLTDIAQEAASWTFHREPEPLIQNALESILDHVKRESPLDGAHEHLAADITRFTQNLLDGKPTGDFP